MKLIQAKKKKKSPKKVEVVMDQKPGKRGAVQKPAANESVYVKPFSVLKV